MKTLIPILILIIPCSVFAQSSLITDLQKNLDDSNYTEVINALGSGEDIDDVYLLNILGQAYYNVKNYDAAIDAFEKVIDLKDEPTHEDYYWLGSSNLEMLQTDIEFFKKAVYSNSAKGNLIKALELKPSYVEPRVKLTNYYINAPVFAGGSITQAKKHANILIEYDKNIGMQLLASIHLNQGDLDLAESLYLELEKDQSTNNEKIYYLLAEVNFRKKDYDKVFEYCKKSIEKYPNYLMGYYQFSKTASITNQNVEDGISYLKKYLEKDSGNINAPGNHWVYYRLGQLEKLNSNTKAAEIAFKNSLKIKPDFKEANDALSLLN